MTVKISCVKQTFKMFIVGTPDPDLIFAPCVVIVSPYQALRPSPLGQKNWLNSRFAPPTGVGATSGKSLIRRCQALQ